MITLSCLTAAPILPFQDHSPHFISNYIPAYLLYQWLHNIIFHQFLHDISYGFLIKLDYRSLLFPSFFHPLLI